MKITACTIILICLLVAGFAEMVEAASPDKVKVASIDFHGNKSFSEKTLRSLMAVRTAGFFRRSTSNPQNLPADLERIRSFYVDHGFLDAEIREADIDTTGKKFRIDITVVEGEATRVQDVVISGNTVFTTRQILEVIPIKPGKPLWGSHIPESVAAIMNLYGRKGYITVVVNPDSRVNRDNHRAIVNFILIEGKQYHVTDSTIRGLRKTRISVVRRELLFKTGDIMDITNIFKSENNLYASGFFNSVLIQPRPAPGDTTGRIMDVTLIERKSGEFGVGFGYETVSGFGGTLSVQNGNLFGTGRKLGLNSKINQKNQIGQVSYTNPWTLDRRLRSDLTSLLEYNQQQPGFDYRRIGGSYVLGRTVRKYMDASIQLRLEGIRNYNIKSAAVTSTSEKGNLRSIVPSLTYDSRNDYFNSRKGTYIELRNALVGSFLGGTVSYNSISLIARRFFPATPGLTIASSFQGGIQNILGKTLVVPLSERLYTGGPTTLRGYGYQKVGPKDADGIPLGGRLLMVGNLELRQHVYKIVGIAAFFETGNVWATPGDFAFSSLRSDAGFGPRVNTPIGTIRVDYAWKFHRLPGEGLTQLYFAFGQSF